MNYSYKIADDPHRRGTGEGDLAAEIVQLRQQLTDMETHAVAAEIAGDALESLLKEAQAKLADSEAACAQMRQCLQAWQAWCRSDGESLTLRDRATELLDNALATDAGAALLAELAALRAVAEDAGKVLENIDASVEDDLPILAAMVSNIRVEALRRGLADLAQAQQAAHGGQGTALQAKDEAKCGEAPGGQQNG